MDVLNEYKSYIGNYVNDDRINEIVMGSLIFKSQLEDMLKKHFEVNDEASIMLSIPGDLDYIYTEESTLDTLVPFTYCTCALVNVKMASLPTPRALNAAMFAAVGVTSGCVVPFFQINTFWI